MALALAMTPIAAHAAFHAVGSSTVTFTATGSMGMRIVGTAHEVDVADDGTTIVLSVPLAHLATGIDLRDSHMRDYLDVAHHPNAVLRVAKSAITMPTTAAVTGDAPGTMELHGRTHAVTVHYRAEKSGANVHVTGSVRVAMAHYGITVPVYLGITVNDAVNVSATFSVVDR